MRGREAVAKQLATIGVLVLLFTTAVAEPTRRLRQERSPTRTRSQR